MEQFIGLDVSLKDTFVSVRGKRGEMTAAMQP